MNDPQSPGLDFCADDTISGFRLTRLEIFNWGTFHNRVWTLQPDGKNSLLTGDIGTIAEAKLIARQAPASLAAAVVVSAHHGSRSSSSTAFVDATLPEHVIHSVGRRNSFGHPHPEVWARWADAGARNWRTDAQGAIVIEFAASPGDGVQVSAVRETRPRYWHGR